jgi:hypothetical protein
VIFQLPVSAEATPKLNAPAAMPLKIQRNMTNPLLSPARYDVGFGHEGKGVHASFRRAL